MLETGSLPALSNCGVVMPNWPYLWSFVYTRRVDSTIQPSDRAYFANQALALALVSIHHNSPENPNNPPSSQYSVVLYSDNPCRCDSASISRDSTIVLAKKLGYKLRDVFGYKLHGSSP
jgi:N-acetylmuramoyl-L-alanine amidase